MGKFALAVTAILGLLAGALVSQGATPSSAAATCSPKVYVTNNLTLGSVSVVNVADGAVSTISIGDHPIGVAITPDGTKAYVANNYGNTVSVINVATGAASTISTGIGNGPAGVAITPDGTKAYVANTGSDNVSVIDVATGSVSTIFVGTSPTGVAITPDGTKAYVANSDGNTVSVINVATGSVSTISDFAVGLFPTAVAITPDGTKAYVTGASSTKLSVINVATGSVSDDIIVGGQSKGVAITPCALLSQTVSADGRTVTVSGSQYAPASTVTVSITSTPLTLGTVTVASNGTFSKSFTVPCTVEAGAHTITATAGSGLRASTPVTLDACAVTLRFTG